VEIQPDHAIQKPNATQEIVTRLQTRHVVVAEELTWYEAWLEEVFALAFGVVTLEGILSCCYIGVVEIRELFNLIENGSILES
jgi:hypothetical protein